MRKQFAAAVAVTLLAIPMALSWAASNNPAKTIPLAALPANTYPLDNTNADVTGDGIADSIVLAGYKENPTERYAKKMLLAVRDGKTGQTKTTELDMGGYEGKLFVGDFTGDHVADVMVSAPTGGSGGIVDHRIATFTGGSPAIIFASDNNRGANFTGKFLEGFKTEITNIETGKSIIIDNGRNRADYVRLGIYDETGHILKDQRPWHYPFSLLEPTDTDRDGVYELKGYQRIVGAYNADPIAEVETLWKYQDSAWEVRKIKISTNLLNNPLPLPAVNSAYTIKRQYVHAESGDIYYPQFEQLESILTQGVLNNEVEEAALKYTSQSDPGSRFAVDYEIARQDNAIVSVIFKGLRQGDGKQEILSSVNLDLNSRQPIVVSNLVKNNEESRQALTALLQQAAAANPAVSKPPVLGDWMGVYFTKTDVVFYYLENDHATSYVKIAVPLDKAAPYFNEGFQL
ncbi:hypothetical protein [Anaerospora hongkongensis]|uniref:hypothetical protein n=1 Tax=Anaerospora hongkongensis TaxID=244830 RepID=UPI00289A48EE|nr:hypothetical protein [Anaerospora hongkongensis]